MPTLEMICLAKSTKRGGICIAGLKTDGSGWLRPVSPRHNGTLYPEHYTFKNGNEPQLFDIIRIPCLKAYPKFHQPENWLIDAGKMWHIVGVATIKHAQTLLSPEIKKYSTSQELLGCSASQIFYEDIQTSPVISSLALIKPDKLQWQIKGDQFEKKCRANFYLGDNFYDLPITDPIWKDRLCCLEAGTYNCVEVIESLQLKNFADDQFRLTISLSEPFSHDGYHQEICYKLVAAVINVADVKHSLGWTSG